VTPTLPAPPLTPSPSTSKFFISSKFFHLTWLAWMQFRVQFPTVIGTARNSTAHFLKHQTSIEYGMHHCFRSCGCFVLEVCSLGDSQRDTTKSSLSPTPKYGSGVTYTLNKITVQM
jgi:hypothetical protein